MAQASATTLKPCADPVDANGVYVQTSGTGAFKVWTLSCNTGYQPPVLGGILKICRGDGTFKQPNPGACQPVTTTCTKTQLDNLIGTSPQLGNTCFESGTTMAEGSACASKCPASYLTVGTFTCSFSEIVGMSSCLASDSTYNQHSIKAIASSIIISLTNCAYGTGVGSCAQSLSQALQKTLEVQTVKVDVKLNGALISSTSSTTFNVHNTTPVTTFNVYNTTPVAPTALQYTVEYIMAVFPSGTLTYPVVVERMYLMAAGATNQYYATLQTELNGQSPVKTLGSIMLVKSPRPFDTSVVVNSLGIVQSYASLPAPIFLPSPSPTSTGDGTSIGLVLGLIFGVVFGALCIFCMCWRCWWLRKQLRES